MPAVGFRAVGGQVGLDGGTHRGMSQAHARIPLGMLLEPGECFRCETLHCDPREDFVELHPVMTNPAVGQNNIGVENLAGQRVDTARADGGADIVVEPADKVVPGILWILLHVRAGGGVLVVNLNGIGQADFIVGLVPHQDALANPAAVAHRRGVLDVENDRVLHRADLELGIGLLEVPSVDVADFLLLVRVLAEVGVTCRKVAHALVGDSRLVGFARDDQADRVVQRLEYAVGRRRGEGQLDVARERLGGADLRELCVEAATPAAEKLRRLADEQRVHVDHRPVLRQQRDDRHIDNHAVGEEALHGGLRLGIAAGTHLEVGLDDQQPLVEPLEVNVLLARLQPGVHLAAGHGGRDKKPLRLKPGRQRAEHLLILLAHVDGEQAGLLVHAGYDLLVALEHRRVRWEVRLDSRRLGSRLGGRLGRGWGLCECGGRHKAKRNNNVYALFFHDKKEVQAGAN